MSAKPRQPPDEQPAPERRNFLGSGNDAFQCVRCGAAVQPLAAGGFRNHCPECLWSRHVDVVPGDRRAECGGMMRPVLVLQRHGEWVAEHECETCGFRRSARLSLTDPQQPDSWDRVVQLTTGAADDLDE